VLLFYSCFFFSPSLISLVSESVVSDSGFFPVSRQVSLVSMGCVIAGY